MSRRLIAGFVLSACMGNAPQLVGAQPSWRRDWKPAATATAAKPRSISFAPKSAAAPLYNEPPGAPPHTVVHDALAQVVYRVATETGAGIVTPDARMFRACEELAAIVPHDPIIDYAIIEFAMQHSGIIEPSSRLFAVWGDSSNTESITAQLQPKVAELLRDVPNARLGIGVSQRANGELVAVIALLHSGLTMRPLPRMVALGKTVNIDAVLDASYSSPGIYVTRPDGTTQRVTTSVGPAGGFTAEVACGSKPGRQQIEITARNKLGGTVLANFPVWCGMRAPRSLTVTEASEEPATSAALAEQSLLTRINRARRSAGLAALVWDERVAEVARRYSAEMHRTGAVVHISPTSGAATDRVREANLDITVVGENLSRAYGVSEAHAGLMNSPGHRFNLMSSDATHVGVGVVFGERRGPKQELFVTELFTRDPPKIEIATTIALVRAKLAALQWRPRIAPALQRAAQECADSLAAGQPEAVVFEKLQHSTLREGFDSLGKVVTVLADIAALDGATTFEKRTEPDIGIGIAQGSHPELGAHAVWVVVLFGEPSLSHAPP